MVGHFWINTYDGMAWSAGFVSAAMAWVGLRAWRGLPGSTAPWPVTLHVGLAFFNILAAALLGILIGFDRSRGFLGVSPLAAMFAHAHLAAIGWATMMVVGLSVPADPDDPAGGNADRIDACASVQSRSKAASRLWW